MGSKSMRVGKAAVDRSSSSVIYANFLAAPVAMGVTEMSDSSKQRKIHIRLTDESHRRLRVRCAGLDTNMQGFVVQFLERELARESTGPGAGLAIDRPRQEESSERGRRPRHGR